MTAVSLYRRGLLILGITILLVFPLNGQQQTTSSLSEIFLLDLGIVIEPSTGEESYDRRVGNPSKEVNFRIKQITSGKEYDVATQKLLTAIERINTRITALEKLFHSELIALKYENKELQQLLAVTRPVGILNKHFILIQKIPRQKSSAAGRFRDRKVPRQRSFAAERFLYRKIPC